MGAQRSLPDLTWVTKRLTRRMSTLFHVEQCPGHVFGLGLFHVEQSRPWAVSVKKLDKFCDPLRSLAWFGKSRKLCYSSMSRYRIRNERLRLYGWWYLQEMRGH